MSTPAPDITTIKQRMKATWEAGDWDRFSRMMEGSSAEFLDRVQIPAGAKHLDVACGSGGLCLMAARAGVKDVSGVDLASNNIAAAKQRAAAENLNIHFQEGDAEALPFPDATLDYVTSIFGAMFAPRPEVAAAELLRVTKPGGTIAMGNWTPTGFVGQMFKTVAKHNPPPAGIPSPLLWGTEDAVRQRFGNGVSSLTATPVIYHFSYPFSPEQVVDFFRDYFGPINRAHSHLGPAEWQALRSELIELWTKNNLETEAGKTRIAAEYLFVLAKRA
jgi:ubiquinone/menaquinone biosynthesis C-methylase UbiE